MKIKMILAIIVCKILSFVGRLIGKGSSFPGSIALKICPDILEQVTLPEYVFAVTGSNGKTSTVEMIAHVLKENNIKVSYNKEGSNQIEGVTTLILNDSTLGGIVKSDVLVIESDERFARHIFEKIQPTYFVITNLYRDQLTRNGHPEWLFDIIAQAIQPETKLILNADDPLVSKFGYNRNNATYFAMLKNRYSVEELTSNYNDSVYCPICKNKMYYEYYHFNHMGKYNCEHCGYHRNLPEYYVSDLNFENETMQINYQHEIKLNLASSYNVYNLLAAFTVAAKMGIDKEKIASSLDNYILKNGRTVRFHVNDNKGMLLISKHENSTSYNLSIKYAISESGINTAVILIDDISRKYFTGETSWLWDIDFELLNNEHIGKIFLVGKYAYDLATRFEMTKIDEDKITVCEMVENSVSKLKKNAVGKIFVLTCFSDKDKILSLLELDDMNVAK